MKRRNLAAAVVFLALMLGSTAAASQGSQPEGLGPLVDWMSEYGVFWRERVRQPPNPPEGDRSMNDDASKSDTQDIVVDEVFPHAPETIWKTLTTGELIGRWIMMTRIISDRYSTATDRVGRRIRARRSRGYRRPR